MNEEYVLYGPKPSHPLEEGTVGQLLHRVLSKYSHLSQALTWILYARYRYPKIQKIKLCILDRATCTISRYLLNFGINGTIRPIPPPGRRQILYLLGYRFAIRPDGAFQIDAQTGEHISFKEILDITCRLAQSLENYGLTRNSVISVCSENSLHFLNPVIAALYLGIVTATLNENYSERELHNVLNISKPQLIFCSKKSVYKMKTLQDKFPYIKKLILLDSDTDLAGVESLTNFLARNSNPDATQFKPSSFDRNDQVALVMCSSGTTGLPKGVMLTHKNMMVRFAHCRDPVVGTALPPMSTVLTFLPLFHAFGMMTTLGYLTMGLRVVLMQRFEAELFLKVVEKYKVESILLVPPLLLFLAKSPLVDQYDISSLKEIGCGAAPLAKEIGESVVKRLNLRGIRQGYGLTESTLAVLFTPPNDFRAGSSGKLVPFVSAKVVDPQTLKALGPNQTGELWFKGELNMKGYVGNVEATRHTIDENGWLRTGDLGYYDEDGFFFVVDRLKELIKYKGFQVPPAELEALLLEHPSIKDAAVVGLPDEEAGELPLAFVTLQPGKRLTEQEVSDFVASQVSAAKRLRGGVRFMDEIPKSATGKILRRQLRELLRKQKSKL